MKKDDIAKKAKKTILIVEDEKSVVAILGEILSAAGYETCAVLDPKKALETAKQVMPDLILLDIVFPTYDGFRIKNELNKDGSTSGIPVIFLTVKGEVSEKIKGFGLGADDYIVKPFDREELVARIEARLRKKNFYEEIAMVDGLTGLYNYKFFDKQFALFFNAAKRYKTTFSIIMLDIDKLKKINDNYGHMAGDFVLQTFAKQAKKVFREADVIIRYGGDEFVVIMPETDAKHAEFAVKRMKDAVNGKIFNMPERDIKISFSVSAGIADFTEELKEQQEMFEIADKKLYEDKLKPR